MPMRHVRHPVLVTFLILVSLWALLVAVAELADWSDEALGAGATALVFLGAAIQLALERPTPR